MNNPFSKRDPHALILLLILLLGAALRFYGISNQSFWVDELFTMNVIDPANSWSTLFYYLKCCDLQPPLFFVLEHIVCSVFGDAEVTARGLSAIFGVASVWTMYLLGEELADKKLGLIAALLTSINYFGIEYSQEVRPYMLLMLLATLSFLYFIKLIKGLRRKDLWRYVLFTELMLYTHYYAFFIVAAQGVVALIFWIGIKENRTRFLSTFAIAMVLILIGFIPWLPVFLGVSRINTFWISSIPADFFITYFFEYFDDYEKLNVFLTVLIAYFFVQLLRQRGWSLTAIRQNPLQLTFFVFFSAIVATYLIAYLRSIYVVPMLQSRYTMAVVPGFILVIAFSFTLVKHRVAQGILLSTFVVLSVHDLVNLKKFYSKDMPRKTQFREMTEFITQNRDQQYPIVEDRTTTQHAYYLKKYNNHAPLLPGNKEATVDSILQRGSSKYDLPGFWIVGAHGNEPHLNPIERAKLDSVYTLVDEREFFDAWAQLFMRK